MTQWLMFTVLHDVAPEYGVQAGDVLERFEKMPVNPNFVQGRMQSN
ncbi:MAG: hypothetical protein WBR17_34290 [Paraburkholderia sp.]